MKLKKRRRRMSLERPTCWRAESGGKWMSLKCSSSSSLLRVLFSSLAGLSSFSVFVSWSDTISKCFLKRSQVSNLQSACGDCRPACLRRFRQLCHQLRSGQNHLPGKVIRFLPTWDLITFIYHHCLPHLQQEGARRHGDPLLLVAHCRHQVIADPGQIRNDPDTRKL